MSGPRRARFSGDSPSKVGAPRLAVFETWDSQAHFSSYSLTGLFTSRMFRCMLCFGGQLDAPEAASNTDATPASQWRQEHDVHFSL